MGGLIRLHFTYFGHPFDEVIYMDNKQVKKTKEEHAAGVREHAQKYGFVIKRSNENKDKKR